MKLRQWICLTLSGVGAVVAGYLGLFEVLLEVTVTSWAGLRVWYAQSGAPGRWNTPRLLTLRAAVVAHAMAGRGVRAVLPLVGFGIVSGWVVTLGWLFVRDPGFVLAREVKETAVDLLLFVPLLTLLSQALNAVDRFELPEEPTDDVRDPEWAPMRQWGYAVAESLESFSRFLQSLPAVWIAVGFVAAVALFYVLGDIVQTQLPFRVLEVVRSWTISV